MDRGERPIKSRSNRRANNSARSLSTCGENDRGKIEPGRLADFVLLDKNIEQTDPLKLRDIQVKMTICGGNIVFQRKGSQ